MPVPPSPLRLTVLLEGSSLAELFRPGGPGEMVLSELVADASVGAAGARCPPGTSITEWRRDLGVARTVLTAPEAAGTPAVMACEFQILPFDAATVRSMMHLL